MRKKVSKDYISDVENFDKLPIYSKRIRNYLNENGITAKELNQKAGFASPSARETCRLMQQKSYAQL